MMVKITIVAASLYTTICHGVIWSSPTKTTGWISRNIAGQRLQVSNNDRISSRILPDSVWTVLRGGAEDADISLHGTVHADSLYLPGLLETAIHRTNKVSNDDDDEACTHEYIYLISFFKMILEQT
jgi:hypothetical protein